MKIAFSTVLRRPGCVIIQAALGGNVPSDLFQRHFAPDTWLVSPTDDMLVYPVTEDQLSRLSAMASAAVAPRPPGVLEDGGDEQ